MKTKAVQVADDYLRLVRAFPLTVIRDDDHAEAAFKFIEPLAVKGEDHDGKCRLTQGEADYLYAMSALLEAYEESQICRAPMTPIDRLIFLLDENGMTASDLGRLLGNRSLGSNILTGKRELSKGNIRVLAERFKVCPALFL